MSLGNSVTNHLWRLANVLLLFCCPLYEAFSSPAVKVKQNSPRRKDWFPSRIQETISYNDVIKSLYLRQIVTETKDMAVEAMKLVVSGGAKNDTTSAHFDSSRDPFGQISQTLSVCLVTKDDGGKIGWVEPDSNDTILPVAVVQELYRRQPKAGDMELVYNDDSDQWHVLQVSEVWMDREKLFAWNTGVEDAQEQRIGSFGGKNQIYPQRKLKGHGVLPTLPSHLQTYTIKTAGCQMNVADSERCKCLQCFDSIFVRSYLSCCFKWKVSCKLN